MARDNIGSRALHEVRALPLHAVLLHPAQQLLRVIPFIQFPTFSRIGMVYRPPRCAGHLHRRRHQEARPAGLPQARHVPGGHGPDPRCCSSAGVHLEQLVRPVTLALRLFGNMFAGHLLLILFATGGEYLLGANLLWKAPVGMSFAGASRPSSSWSCWCSSCRRTSSSRLRTMYIGECPRRRALTRRRASPRPPAATDTTRRSYRKESAPPRRNRNGTRLEGSINMIGYGLARHRPRCRYRPDLRRLHQRCRPSARGPGPPADRSSSWAFGLVEALFIISIAFWRCSSSSSAPLTDHDEGPDTSKGP